jgi:hypothetical protein
MRLNCRGGQIHYLSKMNALAQSLEPIRGISRRNFIIHYSEKYLNNSLWRVIIELSELIKPIGQKLWKLTRKNYYLS